MMFVITCIVYRTVSYHTVPYRMVPYGKHRVNATWSHLSC